MYKAKFVFPESGILLLRASENAPEKAKIEIVKPDDSEIDYDVPLLKISDYSVEKIFKEKLYMLIPFYIFNYENQLHSMNENEDKIDEFFKMYNDIFERLEKEYIIIKVSQSAGL